MKSYTSPDAEGSFIATGEFRPPKKGEFYLSGASPEAYRAPNNLSQAYHIVRPARLMYSPMTGKITRG